ncbi:MAG: hypothetical protein HS130_07800 [Deltaproteobacteria bacterium]|nr:hypothetical protein [Deltaproteobacteria bacterium]MCL4873085.1 hypothetical protein [bacterium]
MAEQKIDVNITDVFSRQLLSAQLVSAFYSALLLKKLSGIELTPAVEDSVWNEVLEHWAKTDEGIAKGVRALGARRAGVPQSGGK